MFRFVWVEILLKAIAIQRGDFGTSSINCMARQQYNLGAILPFQKGQGATQAASVLGRRYPLLYRLYILYI
jgi:hypothetical protein